MQLCQLTNAINLTHRYYKQKSSIWLFQVPYYRFSCLNNRFDLTLAFNYGK